MKNKIKITGYILRRSAATLPFAVVKSPVVLPAPQTVANNQ
jgi:hypothetical protein